MLWLLEKYNQLKNDYESYQKMAEKIIQNQNAKIVELDKKLDMLSLIVEISEYTNKRLGNEDIIFTVNDIMIGILGVTYSSVYITEDDKLELKSTNLKSTKHHYKINEFNDSDQKLNVCLVNSVDNISADDNIEIHSAIYMPIYLKENLLGAIVVEHNIYEYLNANHIKLLTALSNHLAICIENNSLYNKIKESSQRDGLTGLYNRSHFFSIVEKKNKYNQKPYAIIMIDIDNFKKCNDTYGHQCGDSVLKEISSIVKNNLRKKDIVSRYGGEEIIVFMNDISKPSYAYYRMEHIRRIIEKTIIYYNNSNSNVTVSIGIGVSKNRHEALDQVIRRADINLYKAKNSGKNRVIC
ncbi:diguanylate cyclase [Clostridium thailandense]|uniref:GGDEF domain-containing protein n=1 Tax=Clostridium thailandense TaxID=2794346 RepID=A0A949TV47_9CLOT|nr:diguanylate cyclase [Clostridium thailandense]MBV7274076.1 GGDEF domain-containing protein [Clostridium thailandense]MCH5137700.1 GGDEF domain-containing protein [Clostridiaceae bacterium UIB06]